MQQYLDGGTFFQARLKDSYRLALNRSMLITDWSSPLYCTTTETTHTPHGQRRAAKFTRSCFVTTGTSRRSLTSVASFQSANMAESPETPAAPPPMPGHQGTGVPGYNHEKPLGACSLTLSFRFDYQPMHRRCSHALTRPHLLILKYTCGRSFMHRPLAVGAILCDFFNTLVGTALAILYIQFYYEYGSVRT